MEEDTVQKRAYGKGHQAFGIWREVKLDHTQPYSKTEGSFPDTAK